jgi:hypothetical protein
MVRAFFEWWKDAPMAQKVITELIDDLDGSTPSETVRFRLDGRLYEADLSEKNAAKLRKDFQKFVGAARKDWWAHAL